jgi:hypothetical protein
MQAFFQFSNNLGQIAQSPLFPFQNINALNCAIKLAFLFEVELVAITFDQDAK